MRATTVRAPSGVADAPAAANAATAPGVPSSAEARRPSAPYINAGLYYRQKGDLVKLKASDPKEGARQAAEWYRKSLEPLLEGKKIEAALNVEARRQARWHNGKVLDFGWWQLDMELGRTYQSLSDSNKAMEMFRAGLRRRPLPQFYIEMAKVWRELGEYRKAAVALMEGLMIDPSYTEFTSGLVEVYKQLDPKSCAIRQVGGSTNLNLECPMVHDDVCAGARNAAAYYLEVNQRPKALQIAHTAINDLACPADPFK